MTMTLMKSKDAEQIALAKLKEYLARHMDAVDATRGREVFMFGPEGNAWIGSVSLFPKEVAQRATLKGGWIDRPEDYAQEWLRVTVQEDGRAEIEEIVDWRTL
jgi:hypothetical protein